MKRSLLHIDSISVRYGHVEALHDVSIDIDREEIVALIGANGAGKSTLLMSIFGQPKPYRGQIHFDGDRIDTLASHEVAHSGIAICPEGRRIFTRMTVSENLQLGALTAPKQANTQEDMDRVYERFPILHQRARQKAGTLSGGEQQMLAIGRALMARPRLLLLDEPSLGLAPLMVEKIFETLAEIAASGTTLFLVEQNANHALSLASRAYVLVNGEIHLSDTSDALRHNPEVEAAYLGGALDA